MTFSNGYNKLTVGYFELKLHKYILGTPETNITSCKKGHNRCTLNALFNPPFIKTVAASEIACFPNIGQKKPKKKKQYLIEVVC